MTTAAGVSTADTKVMTSSPGVKTTPALALTTPVVKKRQGPGLGVQLLTAGTAACIADMITFPLDTVKVRLQVSCIISASCGASSSIPLRYKVKPEFRL